MMANAGRDPVLDGGRAARDDRPSHARPGSIQDECTICHMPMMRYEAKLAGGEGEAFAHLPPDPGKLADRLADDGVSCTVCHQITEQNLGTRESFVGGFKIDETTAAGRAPHLRSVRDRQGPHDDHEVVVVVSAEGEQAHSLLGAVRHLPHALHPGAGRAGQGDRRAAGAGALSGMAAQRLPGDAELPVLPHAGGEGRRADHLRVRRAARRVLAAHVCRRQFLHAAHAEPVSQRPVGRGATAGNGCRRQPHDCASADGGGKGRGAERGRRQRTAGSRDCGREPGRSQAADRVSVAPRVAARDGARPQRQTWCSSPGRWIPTAPSAATTTTRTPPASSRITRRSPARIRCRFTRASWSARTAP